MTRETRELFTSFFDSYSDSPASSINLKEVRTRFGGVVREQLTFTESEVENMPTALQDGDFATFIADLQFKRVKFIDMFGVR